MALEYGGNRYLPFVDLINLEKVDERTFRSIAYPFSPGGPVGQGRAYGGHVYMQAAWAACQTVEPGFLLHVSRGGCSSLPLPCENEISLVVVLEHVVALHAEPAEELTSPAIYRTSLDSSSSRG